MNDREKLIELITQLMGDLIWCGHIEMIAEHLIENGVAIQKQGEWIYVDRRTNHGVCSNCNRLDSIDPLATHCRYCGAKMKEVK